MNKMFKIKTEVFTIKTCTDRIKKSKKIKRLYEEMKPNYFLNEIKAYN